MNYRSVVQRLGSAMKNCMPRVIVDSDFSMYDDTMHMHSGSHRVL